MVYSTDKAGVMNNLEAIADEIDKINPDIVFLQEVDSLAARSYSINEVSFFEGRFPDRLSSYALNIDALFIPYPIPPIGRLKCGVQTLSRFDISLSTRISLPVPFKWPASTCNFKKCVDVPKTCFNR